MNTYTKNKIKKISLTLIIFKQLENESLKIKLVVEIENGRYYFYFFLSTETELGWQSFTPEAIDWKSYFNVKSNDVNDVYDYFQKNCIESYLDLSDFKLDFLKVRNTSIILDDNIFAYFSIEESNVSYVIKTQVLKYVKKIKLKDREYESEYFINNFLILFIKLKNKYLDGWIIINENQINGLKDGKIVLNIDGKIFYMDDFFLKFTKIYFQSKRYFEDDYNMLFKDVYDYINEFNKKVKLEKIEKQSDVATITIKIDNYNNNYHTAYSPFETEIRYDFNKFIKSKSLKKLLMSKINEYDKVWEDNVYSAVIEYNGREEVIFF